MDYEKLILDYPLGSQCIWDDVLHSKDDIEDFLEKDEEGNYTKNIYFEDDTLYKTFVELSFELRDKVKSHLYNDGNYAYLEISDSRTLWQIQKEIDEEEYFALVSEKVNKMIKMCGVQVYLLGRSSRHVCTDNTLMSAIKYDELCRVQQELEEELIEEINRG